MRIGIELTEIKCKECLVGLGYIIGTSLTRRIYCKGCAKRLEVKV